MTEKRWLYFAVALTLPALAVPLSAGDGVVALQTADPSCANNTSNIYVDCGNGTVTDNRTGLVWLKDANCWGLLAWDDAMATVAGLSDKPPARFGEVDPLDGQDCFLGDHSSPGEWRLPSAWEWRAMVSDALDAGGSPICSPTITDDSGDGCWDESCFNTRSCSFFGVQSSFYWSSTTISGNPSGAWRVDLNDGDVAGDVKAVTKYVWPVRGGQ